MISFMEASPHGDYIIYITLGLSEKPYPVVKNANEVIVKLRAPAPRKIVYRDTIRRKAYQYAHYSLLAALFVVLSLIHI